MPKRAHFCIGLKSCQAVCIHFYRPQDALYIVWYFVPGLLFVDCSQTILFMAAEPDIFFYVFNPPRRRWRPYNINKVGRNNNNNSILFCVYLSLSKFLFFIFYAVRHVGIENTTVDMTNTMRYLLNFLRVFKFFF